jgi:hypothetical protein
MSNVTIKLTKEQADRLVKHLEDYIFTGMADIVEAVSYQVDYAEFKDYDSFCCPTGLENNVGLDDVVELGRKAGETLKTFTEQIVAERDSINDEYDIIDDCILRCSQDKPSFLGGIE